MDIVNIRSDGMVCENCPYLAQCTESRDRVKVVTRHIWEPYLEKCEDIRHTLGMKELYSLRKETIERVFASAKENHGFRYTDVWKSPNGNESRAYICLHES